MNEEPIAKEQEKSYWTSAILHNPRSKSENRLRKSRILAKPVTDRKDHYRKSAMFRSQTDGRRPEAPEHGINRFGVRNHQAKPENGGWEKGT